MNNPPTGSNGDGRKRPRTKPSPPPSSTQKKKAKKLSSIALRALAALEVDDDSSSSSSSSDSEGEGEGERVNKQVFRSQDKGESLPVALARRATDESPVRKNAEKAALQSNNNLRDDTVVVTADVTVGGEIDDDNGDPHSAISVANKAAPSNFSSEGAKESSSNYSHNREEATKEVGTSVVVSQPSFTEKSAADPVPRTNDENVVERVNNSNVSLRRLDADAERRKDDLLATVTSEEYLEDEDIVCAHAPTSKYHDILSSFLSTPFDDKAMLLVHKMKEGIDLNRRDRTKRWILTYNKDDDYLPIIPQKQLARRLKEKKNAAIIQRQTSSLENNSMNCGGASPTSSAAISAKVSSFLLEEAASLVNDHEHEPTTQQPTQRPMQSTNFCDLTEGQDGAPPMNASRPIAKVVATDLDIDSNNMIDIAKLPVVFGFWSDDDGASKKMSRIATAKWLVQGQNAEMGVSGSNNPRGPSSSSSSSSQKSQKVSKQNDAAHPKSELAGPDFPAGWTSRMLEQSRSSTRGQTSTFTYRCYYSPVTKACFQSKNSALTFVELLKEPGIGSSEHLALKEFKNRGYKAGW